MRGKVSDFGVSRMYSSELENVTSVTVATVEYMAPESIMKGLYSVKSDVYSFGMIIWEVLSEKRPFENDDPLSVAFKIVQSNTRPSIGADFPPKLAHLVSKCWHKDPAQRPTFLQIRESLSAFLKSVSKK
jgi:serine/threonine protein kinase